MTISASFCFSGHSDYWGGMGDRGRGHGAAFAYYGRDTTVRDLVDQWVDEAWNNECDFADLPESVTSADIRGAILESFTDRGRDDYESGAVCELSGWLDDDRECMECSARIGEEHESNCDYRDDSEEWSVIVTEDDCDDCDDCCESPIAIMEIDWSDHPDYKPDSDWELCQHDDGHFLWVNKYGRETGPYPDENAAWDDCPDCSILEELKRL